MSEQEFQAYMTGAITSVSAWESALVACESMHQLCEHIGTLKALTERTVAVRQGTAQLKQEILQFKQEITKSVEDVLERTPLIIKPRKFPLDLDVPDAPQSQYLQNLQMQPVDLLGDSKSKLKLEITPCVELSGSPARSLEGVTPEDGQNSISKVNYDIDFSDVSADNSMAEELTPDLRRSPSFTPDPFSPVGSTCMITQPPLIPSSAPLEPNVPTTSVIKPKDDFVLPFLEEPSERNETILDKQEEVLIDTLPSPLKPTTSEYSGFSKQGWQIPSIPCNTGDYSSLNVMMDQATCSEKQEESQRSPQQSKSDDKVAKVLSSVLDTFDRLF